MKTPPTVAGRQPLVSFSRAEITAEDPKSIIKHYGSILAKNSKLPLNHETREEKGRLARESAAIFAADISGHPFLGAMNMNDLIAAADYTDPNSNIGLLSGTIVMQETLALMRYKYPFLNSIATDFSDAPGLLNQTATTRIVLKPAVQTYDPTLDSGGRPNGWTTKSPAKTVDVPITLDEYVGVPLVFGNAELGATMRKLFNESAPAALYALAGHFVDKATALLTAGNFNAYKGYSDAAGATTSGSATLVVTDSTICYPGQAVSGTGIPAGTIILSITDSTHVVMSKKATATGTGVALTLGSGNVSTAYPTYVKAMADFNMACLGEIGGIFTDNEVLEDDRFILLNAQYYARLAQDPTFNTFFAAMRSPETVTKGMLPELQGFNPIKAGYFPKSDYRVGFAGHKASLVLKTRLPGDLVGALPGVAAPGLVSTVTDPDTGLSVLLVQRIDLQGNYAEWRPELIMGAAVGDRRGGLVLTSQ